MELVPSIAIRIYIAIDGTSLLNPKNKKQGQRPPPPPQQQQWQWQWRPFLCPCLCAAAGGCFCNACGASAGYRAASRVCSSATAMTKAHPPVAQRRNSFDPDSDQTTGRGQALSGRESGSKGGRNATPFKPKAGVTRCEFKKGCEFKSHRAALSLSVRMESPKKPKLCSAQTH
jgi:hypothetical protein